jgi:hypothetical protein
MRSKFNSLGKRLQKGDVRANKQLIKELLDDDDDLVEPTLMLLQSGLMVDLFKSNLQRRLPPCCTKMHLVPVKVQIRCVVAWSSLTVKDLKEIRLAAGKGEKALEQLFLFGVRLLRDESVDEHDEAKFIEHMSVRHTAAGKPLEGLKVVDNKVDWDACGCYALCDDDGEEKAPFTSVLHRATGVKATLQQQPTHKHCCCLKAVLFGMLFMLCWVLLLASASSLLLVGCLLVQEALPGDRKIEVKGDWKFESNNAEQAAILKRGPEAFIIKAMFPELGFDYRKEVDRIRAEMRKSQVSAAAKAVESAAEAEQVSKTEGAHHKATSDSKKKHQFTAAPHKRRRAIR